MSNSFFFLESIFSMHSLDSVVHIHGIKIMLHESCNNQECYGLQYVKIAILKYRPKQAFKGSLLSLFHAIK